LLLAVRIRVLWSFVALLYTVIASSSSIPLRRDNMSKPGFDVPKTCCVTGGSGFVGQRLVEMLIERGAERVVSFDIAPKTKSALENPKIVYMQGDLTNFEDVSKACNGCECVFHIAALVGPYHAKVAYRKVNYEGTVNVLGACKALGIKKIVMSSSPSTRFPYPNPDISGLSEAQLFVKNGGDYAPKFLQVMLQNNP
jgi:nucleoside-diphosphate-sugar epimerase